MQIEEEIFKKYMLDEHKLIKYGFIKTANIYKYKTVIKNTFQVVIIIDKNGVVKGKIYDTEADAEYTSFRIENITGRFALTIKENYINILKDIRKKCFTKKNFIYNQSNRLTNFIKHKYHVTPEFLWKENPGFAAFKNNKKWFGLIMNIDKSKLIPTKTGEIEILNLKLDSDVSKYIKEKGIYPAYHMNKKSWVSIPLDDTLADDKIIKLISISYNLSSQHDAWIIPANPKYFDVMTYIESMPVFSWKQPKSIKLNDLVYIYLGMPYSAILYKCMVIELDLYHESNHPIMNLKLLKKYDPKEYPFSKLKEYGLNSVRSARHIPSQLSLLLNK